MQFQHRFRPTSQLISKTPRFTIGYSSYQNPPSPTLKFFSLKIGQAKLTVRCELSQFPFGTPDSTRQPHGERRVNLKRSRREKRVKQARFSQGVWNPNHPHLKTSRRRPASRRSSTFCVGRARLLPLMYSRTVGSLRSFKRRGRRTVVGTRSEVRYANSGIKRRSKRGKRLPVPSPAASFTL